MSLDYTLAYHPLSGASGYASRRAKLLYTQANYLYGPDINVGGQQPWYPAGTLGLATAADDTTTLGNETIAWAELLTERMQKAVPKNLASGGFKTLSDYTKLYNGTLDDLIPDAPYPGILENMDSDFLFSSLRLCAEPWSLRRLKPGSDQVSFPVSDGDSRKISTLTTSELLAANRLFYVGYTSQAGLQPYRLPGLGRGLTHGGRWWDRSS
ncbi:hypothetical protein BCV69DRAFT_70626 [Microstroma glucosiphilum]|uniref:Uncharacterized protein n=1 Tax=Pseudomicrostroma glucosiphilum TaxID=1684307 RepID=A0A316U5Y1_9BASI|nr:hypothetical protein BCV69DRAFT_70626 [Pseudomicrostroma glucosiphilum]PWN18365.1 hypothetical protein BCV69DRAFT_70626 [Pseudomicrostroma glucosiphilum]